MRLLMTTDTVGGVWTFTRELATGLLERGCAVSLVSFGRTPSPSQQRVCTMLADRFGAAFRYIPSDVPLEWMEHNHCAFDAGARILEREAANFQPDLLHSNQFCYGALEVPIPRVVTAHSDVLSWARACRPAPLPPSAWLRSYSGQVQVGLDEADAVVAPTKWMLNALADGFRIPDDWAVISNGVSIGLVRETPRTMQAVTAGRLWDEAKDVNILEQVSSPFPILIAGESRGETWNTASARCIGQLSQHEMHALLRASAVYICTSRYEPFGLAPLEAALCGCAVVARDIPSLHEVWGEGALYFNQAATLAQILNRLGSDPGKLSTARARSLRRARTYTRDRMVDEYMRLYQHTLTHSPRIEHVA